MAQIETLAEWVRWQVGRVIETSRQDVLDLDEDIIPALEETMEDTYSKGVNRAFLLNCIMFRNSGFAVHSNGTGVAVCLAHPNQPIPRTRRVRNR